MKTGVVLAVHGGAGSFESFSPVRLERCRAGLAGRKKLKQINSK